MKFKTQGQGHFHYSPSKELPKYLRHWIFLGLSKNSHFSYDASLQIVTGHVNDSHIIGCPTREKITRDQFDKNPQNIYKLQV